jgi:hypothetical protein
MADDNAIAGHNEKVLTIKRLLKERDDARGAGNFAKSDTMRDQLIKKYKIKIIDQPNGPSGFKFLDGSSNKLNNAVPVAPATTSNKKRAREEEPQEPVAEVRQKKKAKESATADVTRVETPSSKSKSSEKTPSKGTYCHIQVES